MKNSGVSEILGGVLLVSIVITGMVLIGVILISSPAPDSIPRISLSVYGCCDGIQKTIIISHQGGDPIHWSDIKFIVNPEAGITPVNPCCSYSGEVNSSNITSGNSFDGTNNSAFFKTGDTLKIITPMTPNHLIIYKTLGSNQTILDTTFTCSNCQM